MNKLVKKAKNGDKKAFEQLILYYQEDLYKIAKAHLFIEDDINDAIQETIILAYEYIGNLTNISKFKSWLIRILINECNAIYRKKKQENSVSYDSLEIEKYIKQDYEMKNNLEFYSLISNLDTEEKSILILYYVEGYKPKEISKILDINNNTVRSKILRAKNKIKNDLKEDYQYE